MEPVKRSASQIVSDPADTVKHTFTSLTAFKGSRGLTGRERSQTLQTRLLQIACTAVCTPFMPGNKCLNKG